MNRTPLARLWWLTYPCWILLCAILFIAFRDLPDPSRPQNRLDSAAAAEIALAHLKGWGGERFREYEAVDVANVTGGTADGRPRWIVLADHRQRTRLRNAVVIELALADGELLDIRGVIPERAMAGPSLISGEAEPR